MSDFRHLVVRAVEIAGSQQKLAQAAACSQQQISYLLTRAPSISVEMALKLERATGGIISRNELRPDIFGAAEVRAPASTEPAEGSAA
ncbi:YdaS family helix-turn-helix protein [Xanthobacter sp. V0B-10]|uniref:YdaS family helix-turn-helix protein n=1 Tax=Xanthobacter albus TaxID=3119929 RepID=UPI00372B4380